jgi:hypothetical protein
MGARQNLARCRGIADESAPTKSIAAEAAPTESKKNPAEAGFFSSYRTTAISSS